MADIPPAGLSSMSAPAAHLSLMDSSSFLTPPRLAGRSSYIWAGPVESSSRTLSTVASGWQCHLWEPLESHEMSLRTFFLGPLSTQ